MEIQSRVADIVTTLESGLYRFEHQDPENGTVKVSKAIRLIKALGNKTGLLAEHQDVQHVQDTQVIKNCKRNIQFMDKEKQELLEKNSQLQKEIEQLKKKVKFVEDFFTEESEEEREHLSTQVPEEVKEVAAGCSDERSGAAESAEWSWKDFCIAGLLCIVIPCLVHIYALQ